MTASITEARRSSEAFLLGLIGADDEDDADLLPAAAGLHSNGADEETVFLAAKRSVMAQTPDLGKGLEVRIGPDHWILIHAYFVYVAH